VAITIEQTDGGVTCGAGVYCSGLSANSTNAAFLCQDGGTLGSVEKQMVIDLSATDVRAYYFDCAIAGGVTWSAGTWTVRFNLTTFDMDITWASVHICRVNSSCVNQATIGSASSLGISLGAAGVKSTTVSGSAQTPTAGDRVMIVLGVTNASSMGTDTIGITPDQVIDSPFDVPAPTSKPFYSNWRRRTA